MVNVRVPVKRLASTPVTVLRSALTQQLGRRSAAWLLALAGRTGIGHRASAVLVREAERRLDDNHGDARSATGLCRELLVRGRLSAGLRARVLAVMGIAEHRSGRHANAIAHLREALHVRPGHTAWRLDILRAAVHLGDRETFYTHLTTQMSDSLSAAELGPLLADLGQACYKKRDWRAAADAFHHAYKLDPGNRVRKDQYIRARKLAPEWGFYSADPGRAWQLEGDPQAPIKGIVAPISRHLLTGWIPSSAPDTHIVFRLNGVSIADSQAATPITLPDGRQYLQFSRVLKDVWSYAGRGDKLSIENGDAPLEIINRGPAFAFKSRESRVGELLAKLDDRHVINKYGRVRTSILLDATWQADMFDIYTKLRQDLAAGLGLELFPFYGTMLGAVREQNFIGHDNDFDTIYISGHSTPQQVRDEFKGICQFLLARGYDLLVKSTHTWVRIPGTPHKLDIFFAWFNADGYFDASYGYHGTPVKRSPAFTEFRAEKLGHFEIITPLNAEDILAQLYGDGWRTPDPGFTHGSTTRRMDRRYHLRSSELTELHWNQFYRDHQPDRASRFAEFVADRFAATGTVIEFGCGSGRDGIFFAHRGWTTFCCDRSPEGIANADEVLRASGGLPARFDVVDVASADDVRRFLGEHATILTDGEKLVVYLRFFLHAIDEPTQSTLLDTLIGSLTREFYLCAEFRTIEDRDLVKTHGNHYRRYIDHDALAAALRDRWGFDVQHLEAGQGFSPYDGEDPHLARIVAYRPSEAAWPARS